MDEALRTGIAPGQPRSDADAAALDRFERRIRVPLVASAILPLVVAPQQGQPVSIVIGIASWIVFLADYLVQSRHLEQYHRTRLGKFDLLVVVLTAPWFLLPGAQAGGFVVILRLARLARVVMVSKGARRLFARIGRVATIAIGVTVVAALVAYHAEHATNPGFATIGDALWWGVVTLTTVGYGDIVPHTTVGRWAGVAIMFTGIAVLGVLAGSMASFFRLERAEGAGGTEGAPSAEGSPSTGGTAQEPAGADGALRALTGEVAALRAQVESLTAMLSAPRADADGPPAG
ncbi:MAG TPA: ion transporter [Acidimicrobiales bacterium]|nr:ion transporter [Acidimicrobiales bacterium]